MTNSEISDMLREIDAISFCDIIDTLTLEESRVLHASERGVAVRSPSSTIMAVSFSDDSSWMDSCMTEDLIAAHGRYLRSYLLDNGYDDAEPCYLYLYRGKPFNEDYSLISPLAEEHAEKAAENYHDALDYIHERIEAKKIWQIVQDGSFAGFAGFHSEGAMGMLEILPEYRRRKLGEKMEKFLIDKSIEEGHPAYCNVYVSNTASQALQEKLGLVRSGMLTWWMHRKV